MPVTGMEAEFNVILDGVEIDPRKYWGHPLAFIDRPLLKRERSSFQLPTGGAVYFDRGVIEVVTPVIELGPGCAARVVRNLWEQIDFVRRELTKWQSRTGHDVRLKAYSTHYNVSFDVPRAAQSRDRNVKALALLLAYLLPVPVAVVATNRRSTGVGVRPRGNRIEITADFTPDPALMIVTAALVLGIVREVISWPSYSLAQLDRVPGATVKGVVPGRHTTRKGWLTKDFHFPQSPFTCDVDEPVWRARDGRLLSLRAMAREAAWSFRHSIRRHSDPFTFRLLFAVLGGRSPSLLELSDRPKAYEDVGRLCRWGQVLPVLRKSALAPTDAISADLRAHSAERERERVLAQPRTRRVPAAARRALKPKRASREEPMVVTAAPATPEAAPMVAAVRSAQPVPASLPRRPTRDRRARPHGEGYAARAAKTAERRRNDRRRRGEPIPFPDRRLSRSAYEKVFLKLVSGGRLRIGRETYTPVGMKGWYQAVFRRDSDGRERLLTIDQLLKKMDSWEA